MHTKRFWIISLIVVLLTGILIGGAGVYQVLKGQDRKNSNKGVKLDVLEKENNWSEATMATWGETSFEGAEQEEIKGSIESDTWSVDQIYTNGDEVVFHSKRYRAKWWTQGEQPGKDEWGAWEYVGEATPLIIEEQSTDMDKIDVEKPEILENSDFKVVVYYPSWKPNDLDKIQYDVVTHVVYAFAIPTQEGKLRPLDNPEAAQALIEAAHKNNVKVLLAVGGWSYNDIPLEATFKQATDTEEKRRLFVDEIVKLCNTYGFDGVDMDWEHPRVDDSSGKQYEDVMVDLSQRLHSQGKLLTSAVLSGATPDGTVYYDAAAHSDKVLEAVDWIHVMAYDGGDGARHSSYEFAVLCGEYWNKMRKLDSQKIVLGVPFYGRPSWASYSDILDADSLADQKDVAVINGMEAHYNGVATIQKKTRYAMEQLGGIMVWEVTQDTRNKEKSLLYAIKQEILKKKD